MVLNKRHLTGSEYASSSECVSVPQGSAENSPSYSLGSQYARVRICRGCEFVKVTQGSFCINCILKIYGVLNVLSSEYTKVLNASGV